MHVTLYYRTLKHISPATRVSGRPLALLRAYRHGHATYPEYSAACRRVTARSHGTPENQPLPAQSSFEGSPVPNMRASISMSAAEAAGATSSGSKLRSGKPTGKSSTAPLSTLGTSEGFGLSIKPVLPVTSVDKGAVVDGALVDTRHVGGLRPLHQARAP